MRCDIPAARESRMRRACRIPINFHAFAMFCRIEGIY
jgi:hypothetical protein